jgi:osmoprotectant transport system ATP-binding protein
MDESDNRHLTVLDDANKPLGFVTRRAARGAQGTCVDRLTPFHATVNADDNLRVALSKMYQFGTSWMPVLDPDGAYIGEITQDSIADYLGSGRTRNHGALAVAES